MEISVSKRTDSNNYKENPAIGEIVIKAHNPKKTISRININEKEFDIILEEYIDKAENFGDFDIELEDRILGYGINKQTFIEMKKELERQNTNEYATEMNNDDYPAFTGFINFPWKEWKERLLTIHGKE